MSQETLILEAHMGRLKLRKMEIETAIGGNIKATKALLAASSVTPIAKIDVIGAATNLNEAVALKKELDDVIEKLLNISEELA